MPILLSFTKKNPDSSHMGIVGIVVETFHPSPIKAFGEFFRIGTGPLLVHSGINDHIAFAGKWGAPE